MPHPHRAFLSWHDIMEKISRGIPLSCSNLIDSHPHTAVQIMRSNVGFRWVLIFVRYKIFRNLSSCLVICHLCLIFRELIRMSNWSCFTLNMSCHDVMFCHEMWKCSNSSCHRSPDNINCKFVLLRWLISRSKVLTTAWLQFPTLCQLEIFMLCYLAFHTRNISGWQNKFLHLCGIKIWYDRDPRRCVRGVTWHVRSDVTVWRLSDGADIRKSWQTLTSQHFTSENFWHFCTSISHILDIIWLKYSRFNKNWEECWAQTVTDLRAPPSSGSDMTRCSQEFLLRVEVSREVQWA